jgi:hypothetical protein
MGRILALDFGLKRTGIAITDEMNIIASGLKTVDSMKFRVSIRFGFDYSLDFNGNNFIKIFDLGNFKVLQIEVFKIIVIDKLYLFWGIPGNR